MTVTLDTTGQRLDVSMGVPGAFKGLLRGLMGNFNGNPNDDFVRPDGTTIASNSTEEDIYTNFGEKCK